MGEVITGSCRKKSDIKLKRRLLCFANIDETCLVSVTPYLTEITRYRSELSIHQVQMGQVPKSPENKFQKFFKETK